MTNVQWPMSNDRYSEREHGARGALFIGHWELVIGHFKHEPLSSGPVADDGARIRGVGPASHRGRAAIVPRERGDHPREQRRARRRRHGRDGDAAPHRGAARDAGERMGAVHLVAAPGGGADAHHVLQAQRASRDEHPLLQRAHPVARGTRAAAASRRDGAQGERIVPHHRPDRRGQDDDAELPGESHQHGTALQGGDDRGSH